VLSREVAALANPARAQLRWFVLDLDAVDDVDYSAGATLLSLKALLRKDGVQLKILRASPAVRRALQGYGLGGDGYFTSIREMRRAFEAA
jgi:sulfate permease, SulP family